MGIVSLITKVSRQTIVRDCNKMLFNSTQQIYFASSWEEEIPPFAYPGYATAHLVTSTLRKQVTLDSKNINKSHKCLTDKMKRGVV